MRYPSFTSLSDDNLRTHFRTINECVHQSISPRNPWKHFTWPMGWAHQTYGATSEKDLPDGQSELSEARSLSSRGAYPGRWGENARGRTSWSYPTTWRDFRCLLGKDFLRASAGRHSSLHGYAAKGPAPVPCGWAQTVGSWESYPGIALVAL